MWASNLFIPIMRGLLGVSARWQSTPDLSRQKIYFANHTSHIDTLAIISALPKEARIRTRPVAAADYWGKNKFLSYFSQNGLNAVLIERNAKGDANVLEPVCKALKAGDSVIIFPEGTRSCQALPGSFKSGLYRLHKAFPNAELVPMYLDNLYRSMPKGKHVPLPIICTIRIGDPIPVIEDEEKEAFLTRARDAVVRLAQ